MLGYEKVAQTKPSSYPENNKIPINTHDRDDILDSEDVNQDITDKPFSSEPQQLSGEPRVERPDIDMQQLEKSDKVTFKPFDLMQDTVANPGGMTTDTVKPNEKQIRVRPILDVEDIHELNHYIAKKMEKLGVLTVDKDMFMKRYEEWYEKAAKIAALQKKPISEVFDELL